MLVCFLRKQPFMQPDKEILQQKKVVASNSCFELSAGQAQGKKRSRLSIHTFNTRHFPNVWFLKPQELQTFALSPPSDLLLRDLPVCRPTGSSLFFSFFLGTSSSSSSRQSSSNSSSVNCSLYDRTCG